VDLTPRTTIVEGWAEDQGWLASDHGIDAARSITIDLTLFTTGHLVDTNGTGGGDLPSGTKLARVTATGFYGPYDNALANGQQTLRGHLLRPVKARAVGVGAGQIGGHLYWHGSVVAAKVPGGVAAEAQAESTFILYV